MSRRKCHPLRVLTNEEQQELVCLSREHSASAEWVIRAKLVLLVSQGSDYQAAARAVGRRDGDSVSSLVKRFNEEGMVALVPRHGGGPRIQYGLVERARILREVERRPSCEEDGTAQWSLSTLQRSLRQAGDGLPRISEFTIRKVLLEAGYDWQHSRTGCQTGQAVRKRKAGMVVITDPDSEAKKSSSSKPTSSAKHWG